MASSTMAGRFVKRSIHFSVRDLSLMHHIAIRTGQVHFKRSYVSRSRGLCSQDDRNNVKGDKNMQQNYYKMTHINPTPFDTLSMVKDLEKSGFTAEQAEALVGVLVGVATHSSEQALSGHVSHQTLDLLELKLKGQIDAVRSEQLLLEKGVLARVQDKSEAIDDRTLRLTDLIKEEVGKVQTGVQLDINLERSRSKENDAIIEQKIKDAYHQVENEIATLKTTIESQKLEVVKYIAGGTVTLVTLLVSVLLGMFRLWK